MSHEIKNKQINSPILYRLVRPLGVLLTRGIFRPRVFQKRAVLFLRGIISLFLTRLLSLLQQSVVFIFLLKKKYSNTDLRTGL